MLDRYLAGKFVSGRDQAVRVPRSTHRRRQAEEVPQPKRRPVKSSGVFCRRGLDGPVIADPLAPEGDVARSGATGDTAVLTPREGEVAGLVAKGLTSLEIAGHLVVSQRTVEGHVQAILNTLGFDSRTQIAVWAVEHGLRDPDA